MVEPVLKVVIHCDALDSFTLQGKKCSGRQIIGLPAGFGKALIGGEVGAVNHEFRRRARAVVTHENLQITDALAIAAVHPHEEFTKRLNARFAATLIDVVHNVIRHQGQHAIGISSIEAGVVIF